MNDFRPYKNQVYETLIHHHDSSELFVDPEFPAIRQSLFPSGQSIMRSGRYVSDIIWRRPSELFDDPRFVVDGFKCGDLDQGELGNCWFIAAANALSLHDDLRERTVPSNQSFSSNKYAGIFHFRFWSYGQWYDIVIDDQLPWHPDVGLIFCNNTKEKNEMWAALLEKAYAKFCGSYEAVIGGRIEEALIHMTGGMGEIIRISTRRVQERNFRETLRNIIWQAYSHKSLLGCSISPSAGVLEGRLANGLVQGHAYTITGIADVMTSEGPVTIIRCLNPWGNHEEWSVDLDFEDDNKIFFWWFKGRESFQITWNRISTEEKRNLRLHKRDDGEFWMSLDDFMNNFTEVQICHQKLTGFTNESSDETLTWREIMFHGAWVPGSTAGGCGNGRPENFWKNPQYLIHLNLDDDTNRDQLCTMIIFLTIKKPNERHARRAEDEICFQFRVYKVIDDSDIDETIEQGYFKFDRRQLTLVKDTGTYTNSLALSLRIDAEPGSYIIIPSTFDANTRAEFFFRVFIETQHYTRQSYGEEDPRSSGSIIRGASSTRQWSVENSDENDTPDDCRISDDDRGCSVM